MTKWDKFYAAFQDAEYADQLEIITKIVDDHDTDFGTTIHACKITMKAVGDNVDMLDIFTDQLEMIKLAEALIKKLQAALGIKS